MRLWVDALRDPPDATWSWAKTSTEAIEALKRSAGEVTEMSLDHDLGGEDTTRPVVLWLCENGFWPQRISVHTANPVGREWLEGMIGRYMPA